MNKENLVNIKKLVVSILLSFLSLNAMSKQIPTVTQIMKTPSGYGAGSVLVTSSSIAQAFPATGSLDYDIQNTVALKYDLNTDTFFLNKTTLQVKVSVTRWDASSTMIGGVTTKTLTIIIDNKLNRTTLEQGILKLTNGYKVQVVINNIWLNGTAVNTLPYWASVETEINMDRYYDFSSSVNTAATISSITDNSIDCDATDDEILVTWAMPVSNPAFPEEYQLEWVYVNRYSPSGATYPSSAFFADFKNNSTRITTYDNSYKISLLYDKGFIAFRVRAVGRDWLNPSKYVFGPWSELDFVQMNALVTPAALYTVTQDHENSKNWQFAATYAEEGKKKEVINYFDGSLHNRQTVTKVNSDKNVIIGETMYDYQGRPAVNVLPVPVNFPVCSNSEPSIKYYPKFNTNSLGDPYSKENFDEDASACNVSAAYMDKSSGASQYYSDNNPDISKQQAFLPHAQQYPFTQVEYTPDNTGRIRAQSGVGPNYQLGSGKETKYYYGQPNQLQLDRLFASEAGDATHYKKNVVIDANGQTSVTYLNQEGKTVATALAGPPPTEPGGPITRMDSLTYANANQATFTIDMFNKDASGKSLLNAISPSNDKVVFSSQLLVPFRSQYNFNYTLSVDTVPDACLRSGICFNCVYDLEIQIVDECGDDIITSSSGPLKKNVGKFTLDVDNNLVFSTVCSSPTAYTDAEPTISFVLQPGVYTINKVLSVNKEAKDFYVKAYLDSVNNSCFKTLSQFQAAELAKIDTSDCYVDCASCIAELGSMDDFVASGRGTADQWYYLADKCNEPCRRKTLCDLSYEMMLSDVSPGGQYGKFNSTTFDASTEPVSVYNTGNSLRPRVTTSWAGTWHAPIMRINSAFISGYFDEDGIRKKINVTETSPGVFSPQLVNSTLVYTDPSTNLLYTYPENLKNLSDFMAEWDPNFAKALVIYHPEYVYYLSCKEHAIEFPGTGITSDAVDSLMEICTSFNQAQSAGFIDPGAKLSAGPAQSDLTDIVNLTSGLFDPFFSTAGYYYYSTTINPVTGRKTTVKMIDPPYNFDLNAEMNNIINNYKYIGTTPYTMADVAAIVTRCGNNFSTTPTAACMAFGNDFYPSTYPGYAALNDSIRNQEWRLYRQFYLAEKQKLQFRRMNFYARYISDSNSNLFGGCNACIGNSGYDPFATGMIYPAYGSWPYTMFYTVSQPCSYASYTDYGSSTKRFYDPAATGLNPAVAAVQLYNSTGQCPITFDLQNFLSALAKSGTLTVTNSDLTKVNEFNPDLYKAVNGGINPATFISFEWQVSMAGNVLTGLFVDPATSTTKCTLTVTKPSAIANFSDIIAINQLVYDAVGPGNGTFKAVAVYTSGSSTLSANITGNASCLDLKNCVFDQVCSGNQMATDFLKLFNYLKSTGQESSTTAINLYTNPVLKNYITPTLYTNVSATSGNNLVYKFVSPDKYMIYESTGTTSLVITVTAENPAGVLASAVRFSSIRSNYNNKFKMDAMDGSGNKIGEVEGTATRVYDDGTTITTYSLSMGVCDIPELAECATTEHKVRHDLELLVKEILTKYPFTYNLYTYASFSPLLESYLPSPTVPTASTTTGSYYSQTGPYPNEDTLRISLNGQTSSCTFKLYHYRNNGSQLNFTNIIDVSDLHGEGTPDIAGNYTYFYAIATYKYGTTITTDTIHGRSCWPIKNCDPCPYHTEGGSDPGLSRMQSDSMLVAEHNAFYIPSIPYYKEYSAAIDSVNSRNGWSPANANYIPKMKYKTFADKAYHNSKRYIAYIKNYNPQVDDHDLLLPDTFLCRYGNLTNCNLEYDRYSAAITAYNTRALSVPGSGTLSAIQDSVFYHNHLCDSLDAFVRYLNGYPTTGPNPQNILQYNGISNPYQTYTDSGKVEYDRYIKVHRQFTNDPAVPANRKNAHPLYGFDAIQSHSLTASSAGMTQFKSYINSLTTASVSNPSPVPSMLTKTSIMMDAGEDEICQEAYIKFLNAIEAYNGSAYAAANGTIDINIYPTFYSFLKAGYCNCVNDYIAYLEVYTMSSPSPPQSPVIPDDIDHWTGCPHTIPFGIDSCDLIVYTAYYAAVTNYNNYVLANYSSDFIAVMVPYLDFAAAGYCKCGVKFAEGLEAIVAQNLDPSTIFDQLDISVVCGDKPCSNGPPDSTFVFPPYVKYDNPCVQQQINLALQNAANAYQQYYDSLTTYFADKYTRHCLNAFEDFNYTYDDKEYHFTLYYYDQAGNLVKTVPPEGFTPQNVTSYLDATEQKIISDRTYNQQTVFTDHGMATNYVYNSLNQLICQSLPDHDPMDICDGRNPTGLDSGLVVNAVQFVNSNKGYLCGYVLNSQVKRGYVYTSDDGGNSWRKLDGVTAANMQKVQFVTSSIGYAVADFGMLFKTIDGGNTWDIMTGLYTPTSGTRQISTLFTLHFINSTTGVVGGIKNGAIPFLYYTNNGGDSFSAVSVAAPVVNGDTCTAIAHDGSTYVATSRNGTRGFLYYSTNGTNWFRITAYNVNNLKKVRYLATGGAYAVGDEGTLLFTNIVGSTSWTVVPTGYAGNIRDAYFKNTSEGIALIDSIPGKALLYKTSNGGLTWTLLGDHGEHYNALEVYDRTNHKLTAVGQTGTLKGIVARVLLSTQPFGIVRLRQTYSSGAPLHYGDIVEVGTTGQMIAVVTNSYVGGTPSPVTYQMFTTLNAQDQYPVWEPIGLSSWGMSQSPQQGIKKILIKYTGPSTNPIIQALVITTTGKLYGFSKAGTGASSAGTFFLTGGSITSGAFFSDITRDNSGNLYAYDNFNKQFYAVSFAGPNPWNTTATARANSNAIISNVNSVDVNYGGTGMVLVADGGQFQYSNIFASPPVVWNSSTQTVPTAFTDVKFTGTSGDFIVTGIDGSVWKNSSTSSIVAPWNLKNTGTAERLNAIDLRGGDGLIVGNNGKIIRVTGANTSSPAFAFLVSPSTANLTDVAIDQTSSPAPAYITASDGSVMYTSDFTAAPFSIVNSYSPYSVNGVSFRNPNNAVVVGNSNLISTYYGNSYYFQTKNIHTRGLYSVHFTDANNGYVIDSINVIRRTTNGGNTWSVVLPTAGGNKLNNIYCTKTNQAVLVGNNRYLAIINGNTLTQVTAASVPVPSGTNLYDINFNKNNFGVIACGSAYAIKIVPATATTYNLSAYLQATTTSPPDFRTVHVFNDNSFIIGGTAGSIYYHDNALPGNWYLQNTFTPAGSGLKSAVTIKDIFFHDEYAGYFVGDRGNAFKVKLNSKISSYALSNQLGWTPLCTSPIYMAYNSTQVLNLDFRTVAFQSRINGMIAGADGNSVISSLSPNRYSRLIKEESGYYSTKFWYDKLGRLVVSQNTKQYNKVDPANSALHAYSYTLYDNLGRITEVGEKYENTTATTFTTIFGSKVNGYDNANSIDSLKFLNWINGNGNRREVTKTYYDNQTVLPSVYYTQNNLRKRVASTTYEDSYDGIDSLYDHGTHYSYDIHGNVSTLWQQNKKVGVLNQGVKQMNYQYDLISGKVNKVIYSPGLPDQFVHRYTYDADNRITKVETSKDNQIFELDAKYFYYAHGPLARIEYGKDHVQGIDYAYTLQGWIKGINSNLLDPALDMGNDGDMNISNPNGSFARDVMAYSLNYYLGDYETVDPLKWSAGSRWEADATGSDLMLARNDLFNGNITAMATTISQPDSTAGGVVKDPIGLPLGSAYRYDQLNRLTRSSSMTSIDAPHDIWDNSGSIAGLYRNTFSYDANGNIKTQMKYDSTGTVIDSLIYEYEQSGGKDIRNRLYHVADKAGATAITNDIEILTSYNSTNPNQTNNYSYDEIGNLVKDAAEGIDSIRWSVYGKIKAIRSSTKDNLFFDYDASGNRIAKHVYTSGGVWKYSTFYERDAQGNVMSVYDKRTISSTMSYKLDEQHLYGSSRLGMINPALEMIGATVNNDSLKLYLGHKNYELTNHLGNVLTVISDKKIQIESTSTPNTVDHYVSNLVSATDYYPFGAPMYGRNYNSTNYRHGFNGKEKDDEIKGSGNSYDFGARIYDPRLGRWLACDPLARKYPDQSPYDFAMNTPISAYDPDGKRVYFVAGAGNDQSGWNYSARFQGIWASVFGWKNAGANDFKRINASNGKFGDMTFVDMARNNQVVGTRAGAFEVKDFREVKKAVNDIVEDLHKNPLKEGEQLNLTGYSYGAVLQEHVAIALAEKGYKIDNLILIGSPTEDGSQLMGKLQELQKAGKIGQIIRHDIPGDKLSNPSGPGEYMEGAVQNSGDGPHFDLARPDNPDTKNVDEGAEANKKIYDLGKDLKSKGVESKKD